MRWYTDLLVGYNLKKIRKAFLKLCESLYKIFVDLCGTIIPKHPKVPEPHHSLHNPEI